MKKTIKFSVIISAVLAVAVLVFFLVMAAFVPDLVEWYCAFTSRTPNNNGIISGIVYAGIIPAVSAAAALLKLLGYVGKGEVFAPPAIRIISFISICCFVETVIFAVLSAYFIFSLIIAFAAFFMGMILTVVKDVIHTAMEVKLENDFTI